MKIIKMSLKEFKNLMNEIDSLQSEVDNLLYNKNPLIRFFKFKEAIRLHKLASQKLDQIFFGIEIVE